MFTIRWVVDHMLSLGFSKSLSEWIGSNLKDNEHVTWSFDLQAAIDMFNSYRLTLFSHTPPLFLISCPINNEALI
jgi:hypothetical protein